LICHNLRRNDGLDRRTSSRN